MISSELGPVLAYFGGELCRLRKAVGLTQAELGKPINYTGALVDIIEAGSHKPSQQFVEACDRLLQADGALSRIWPLIGNVCRPEWFEGFAELESSASTIRSLAPLLVPDLLQTPEYARAVLAARMPPLALDDVNQGVADRVERQRILDRPSPPVFWCILGEAALRDSVSDREVMRVQLKGLLKAAEHRRIVIQIMPSGSGVYAGHDGGLTLLSFENDPDVGYINPHGCAVLIQPAEQVAALRPKYDMAMATAPPPELSAEIIRTALENL
jgi:transcriptional regulator with XRE-family HTH domain